MTDLFWDFLLLAGCEKALAGCMSIYTAISLEKRRKDYSEKEKGKDASCEAITAS